RLMTRVVEHLQAGKVIGWFQGRFELGPRALGNRSILADPRNPSMKDIVNTKIKFREPFRPFAPSVLVERAEEFFDLPDAARHHPARYMLYVVDVKAGQGARIPAVTHVDGTARLQTFFWSVKLWWMIPMVLTLLLLGGIIIFAQSSAIAPFIYTVF